MEINYRCCCEYSGKCSYVKKLQAAIYQMEKDGKDFSFINFYINADNDICRQMSLYGSRVDITCGYLKEHSSKDLGIELNEMFTFFRNREVVQRGGYEEEDDEPADSAEGDHGYLSAEEDYGCLSPGEKLERIKRKIREASGKNFVVEIVRSIGGDANQAQAQIDGFTVKIGKGLINNLDEDELASVVAHEVAHLEDITERNKRNHEEEDTKNIGTNLGTELEKMDESLKNSGAGKFVRTIAQVAVLGIGVAGGIAISKGKRRENENAADSRAVDMLHKAGYDPEAEVRALEKIDRHVYRRRGFLEDVLSTHPETKERIRNIKDKARNKKK